MGSRWRMNCHLLSGDGRERRAEREMKEEGGRVTERGLSE